MNKMKCVSLHALAFCVGLISFSPLSFSAEYITFFLGGQSNMEGYGYVSRLPEDYSFESDTMIFHGNGVFDNEPNGGLGVWSRLKPGHGTGFATDGVDNFYSDRFGPELTFANAISKQMPDKKIAIIKYAVGGTGLHLETGYGNWSPEFEKGKRQNQYDFALNTIRHAFASRDIDGDGVEDTLIPSGIIWMQGEADAHAGTSSANAYFENLNRLMGLLRAAFRDDSIPVVIGKITDSEMAEYDIMPYIKRVHLAQETFIEQDVCAAYMTNTETYSYDKEDAWHYSSDEYLAMGFDFAKTFIELKQHCKR